MRKKKEDLELVRIEKETLNRLTGRRVRRFYERPRKEPLRVRVLRGALTQAGMFFVAAGLLRLF